MLPNTQFSIVTRTSSKAWIPELIAAAGPEVTETYIDFFTATIRNRNTRQPTRGRTHAILLFITAAAGFALGVLSHIGAKHKGNPLRRFAREFS